MSRKSGSSRRDRLIWTVGAAQVDESSWRLRVAGRDVDIEQKPMELLLALLHRNGEVVTKDELLDLVWPGVTVVPASLPTAIAKLRRALGDEAAIVETGAHSVGVLHLDLKPSNLLVSIQADGPRVRVIDFGSSVLLDHPRLRAAALAGMTITEPADSSASSPAGTPLYAAPELIGSGAPSAASDIYALGLILFQVLAGDLNRPLAPGWEDLIDDPLLRDDIARASALDPAHRFPSAELLADNLATLDVRRAEAARVAAEAAEGDRIRREVERTRARRPWAIAAGVALTLGVVGASAAAWEAARARDEARRQTAITTAINSFLADDLLARGDPSKSGSAGETLIDATRRAEPEIGRRFGKAPLVAARLYHTLARVYAQQSDWAAARAAYTRADAAYARAGAADSKPAAIAGLQHASTEALSYTEGSVERARAIIAQERARLPGDEDWIDPEVRVWLASARGMVELAGGDIHVSRDQFGLAAQIADSMPGQFDARTRNDFHQRYAFTLIRLGDGKGAEAAIKPLLAAQARLLGPTNPDVLLLRMNLGQAYLYQRRFADAVKELSAVLPLMRQQLGPDHRLVQQTLAARVEAYGDLGNYRASIADGRELYAIALKQQGLRAFRPIVALSDLATSECRAPDLANGVAHARKAYRASLDTFGSEAALTQGVAMALAQCLIEVGQDAAAAPLIAHIDRKAVAELASDPHWGANIDLAQAEISVHAQRWEDAAADLHAAAVAYASPQSDVFQHRKFETLSALVARSDTR